mgnify:CR=1 FL=1
MTPLRGTTLRAHPPEEALRGTALGAESYLASTGGSNRTFVDVTLTASQTRYYTVSAVTAAGEGAQSAEAFATTTAAPTAPSM